VQESFLRAWKFRDSLATGSSFKPWLYRVVVNTCNSKLRKEIPHRNRRRPDDDLDDVAMIEDPIGRVTLSYDVMTALRDLPAHLRCRRPSLLRRSERARYCDRHRPPARNGQVATQRSATSARTSSGASVRSAEFD